MSLVPVYFNEKCGDLPYTKAIVPEIAVEMFLSMGAVRKEKDIGKKTPKLERAVEKKTVASDDEKLQGAVEEDINRSKAKKPIIEMIEAMYGEKLSDKPTLAAIKEKALKIVRGNKR